MAVIKKESTFNVKEAAYQRVENVFSNGVKVYLSMSGGKDSIVVAQIVYDLIKQGRIDKSLLTVLFIDEEGMYDDVIKIVHNWRNKFMLEGVKFDWYAMQYTHFNSLNQLTSDETWICWDITQQDKWMRQPPKFAIRNHPLFNERRENYQAFTDRLCKDGITITGQRTAESFTRNKTFIDRAAKSQNLLSLDGRHAWVIYDWSDNDVWLFLREKNCEIPDAYIYMYQIGIHKRRLRISNFFAIDTIGALVYMEEAYPDLWERILKREPNAYLVSLYWNSEMFGRSSRQRKSNEASLEKQKDYDAELRKVFANISKYFPSKRLREVAEMYKRMYFENEYSLDDRLKRKIYEALMKGDTKLRSYRSLLSDINKTKWLAAIKEAEEE